MRYGFLPNMWLADDQKCDHEYYADFVNMTDHKNSDHTLFDQIKFKKNENWSLNLIEWSQNGQKFILI